MKLCFKLRMDNGEVLPECFVDFSAALTYAFIVEGFRCDTVIVIPATVSDDTHLITEPEAIVLAADLPSFV